MGNCNCNCKKKKKYVTYDYDEKGLVSDLQKCDK